MLVEALGGLTRTLSHFSKLVELFVFRRHRRCGSKGIRCWGFRLQKQACSLCCQYVQQSMSNLGVREVGCDMGELFVRLNRLAASAVNHSEIVAAFFVLAVIFMMVLPLPTWLVDSLIALNICIATLLVVFAMYLPGPLAFSTFPGVLLLTTLFRLALSITTTRLILLQADAGHIVQAFGDFVVGGDLVVGLVIFFILTIVQFLVITKGSERIAEVAARFSLDAMPGKQMSIDSDLRAGMIDSVEARRRRDSLSSESQLFGAMDGAMKFVKGDAIAGLVIVAVNLLGGLAVGTLKHDMSAGDAVHVYSVLTIGDGLVAQIPALLISLTAGMIVTRVNTGSSQSDANVGREMAEQILSQPRAWMIASAAMLLFAVIPGMPTSAFLVLGVLTLTIGVARMKGLADLQRNSVVLETPEDRLAEVYQGHKDVRRFDPVKPYLLKVGQGFLPAGAEQQLVQSVRRTRNIIVAKLGMTLPSLEIDERSGLRANQFEFLVNEIPKLSGGFYPEHRAVFLAATELVDVLCRMDATLNPADIQAAMIQEVGVIWVPSSYSRLLAQAGVNGEESTHYIARKIEKVLLQTGSQFIGIQETHALMGWLESEQSELAKELQRSVPTAKFAEVLQRLASERVSLRSLRQIAEALIEWGQKERDAAVLAEHVRTALRYQICHEFSREGHLNAIFLSNSLQNELRLAVKAGQNGGYVAVSPPTIHHVITEIGKLITASLVSTDGVVKGASGIPPALIVPGDIRRVVRRIIENDYFQLPVLSFTEITPEVQLNPIGEVGVAVRPKPGPAEQSLDDEGELAPATQPA